VAYRGRNYIPAHLRACAVVNLALFLTSITGIIPIPMASQSTLSSSSLAELNPPAKPPSFPPSEIQYRGREWVRIDHRENLKRSTPQSKVWDYGDEYIAIDNPDQHAWRCRNCSDGNSLIVLHGKSASTSPAARHLKKKHGILLYEDEASDLASTTTDGRELPVVSGLIQRVDVEAFRYHLLRWIVNRQVAFIEIEDEDFRQMLLCLSQTIEPYLVQCGDTLRNWLDEEYILAKRQVKQCLSEAKSKIHISFDLWTSPNALAICAVVAHFVNINHQVCNALIGFKRIKGGHAGENIAEVVIPVLEEYEVSQNLGVFVTDNADSNDTAIRAILKSLRPDLNISDRRARCLGHIINLAAKAFIFSKGVTAFEASVNAAGESAEFDSDSMQQAQAEWRQRGAIGKFHNIVVFIRSSPQRREAFRRCLPAGDDQTNGGELL
jgi:hypothetical protein